MSQHIPVGMVCGACRYLNPMGSRSCSCCSAALILWLPPAEAERIQAQEARFPEMQEEQEQAGSSLPEVPLATDLPETLEDAEHRHPLQPAEEGLPLAEDGWPTVHLPRPARSQLPLAVVEPAWERGTDLELEPEIDRQLDQLLEPEEEQLTEENILELDEDPLEEGLEIGGGPQSGPPQRTDSSPWVLRSVTPPPPPRISPPPPPVGHPSPIPLTQRAQGPTSSPLLPAGFAPGEDPHTIRQRTPFSSLLSRTAADDRLLEESLQDLHPSTHAYSRKEITGFSPGVVRKAGGQPGQVCAVCRRPLLPGTQHCSACGARVSLVPDGSMRTTLPPHAVASLPRARARLILVRGENDEGTAFPLRATEQGVGRSEGEILLRDDEHLSPFHATVLYRNNRLYIRNERSLNGIFLRIRGPMDLAHEDCFLAGEELLRFELIEPFAPAAEQDGTYFYSSPPPRGSFRLVQLLEGGQEGLVYCARHNIVVIGRENADINFPFDRFISRHHTRVERAGNLFLLADLGSKNGTYLKLRGERELLHNDFIFLGKNLMRVDIPRQ